MRLSKREALRKDATVADGEQELLFASDYCCDCSIITQGGVLTLMDGLEQ